MRLFYRFALAFLASVLGIVTVVVAQPFPHVAPTPHLSPEKEKAAFRLPEGFEAQLIAAEPDIQKPMNIAWDARGRLWVTDTVEYPYALPVGQAGRDRVVILSDFDETGLARKKTVFAEGMNIPIGVLPLPNANEAIVYSIPYLYHIKDTDGDGKADEKKVLYGLFGHRDTHGMINSLTLGLDGWVYACHGFANDSVVKGADGQELRMQSGNTFRFKVDGSRVEPYTRGQVNPFGMAVDPLGFLYTADCHSRPMTQLIRGAHYDSFGKPHDGLGYGPSMIGHDHDSTGLCGLVYYDADHYPPEYRGSMFLGNVVTSRVNRDTLKFNGSSPQAVAALDFVSGTDPWFRPVDLKLGPDGAIYIADFYNRIIGHYEVPLNHPGRDRTSGRIWRIVYKTAPKMPRADWTTASTADLIADLGSSNLVVRYFATHQLVRRGAEVLKPVQTALERPTSPAQQAHALWVLERLGGVADATLNPALAPTADANVQAHALRILGERSKLSDEQRTALEQLREPRLLRIAAEVLGRHPNPNSIPALLAMAERCQSADAHLRHAIKVALRDTVLAQPTALVQMDHPAKHRAILTQVAIAVPKAEAALFLARALPNIDKESGRAVFTEALRHIARYGNAESNESAVGFLTAATTANDVRLAGFQALQRGSQEAGKPLPAVVLARAETLARESLASQDGKQVQAGIELAASLRLGGLREPLLTLINDAQRPEAQRISALPALAAIDAGNAVPVLVKVLTNSAEPLSLRERAAQVLAGINQPAAQRELIGTMSTIPARLAVTVAAELALSPQGAEVLLAAVKEGKASPRLLQERIVQQRLNERKLPNLPTRISELTKGLPTADDKMLALMKSRGEGFRKVSADRALGAKIFEKNCAICHQLAGQGAKIGPQLDGIGNRGLERLLEDILDPSRNVDQALRTTVVELKNGQVVTGLQLREEGEVVVFADAQGKEVRVPKNMIEEKSTSLLSPMPANFAEQVSEAEFYHLMAFLLEQKQK